MTDVKKHGAFLFFFLIMVGFIFMKSHRHFSITGDRETGSKNRNRIFASENLNPARAENAQQKSETISTSSSFEIEPVTE